MKEKTKFTLGELVNRVKRFNRLVRNDASFIDYREIPNWDRAKKLGLSKNEAWRAIETSYFDENKTWADLDSSPYDFEKFLDKEGIKDCYYQAKRIFKGLKTKYEIERDEREELFKLYNISLRGLYEVATPIVTHEKNKPENFLYNGMMLNLIAPKVVDLTEASKN